MSDQPFVTHKLSVYDLVKSPDKPFDAGRTAFITAYEAGQIATPEELQRYVSGFCCMATAAIAETAGPGTDDELLERQAEVLADWGKLFTGYAEAMRLALRRPVN